MNDRRPHRPSAASPASPARASTPSRTPSAPSRPPRSAGQKPASNRRAHEASSTAQRGPKRDAGAELDTVVGIGAARAVLVARPTDVLGIAYTAEARGELGELLREAARHRIAYREVPREELARMADTIHHEGISLRVRARAPLTLADLTRRLGERGYILAVDGVDNPHNLGALLRSAAYFGATGFLLEAERSARLPPAAVRVAEGGAEAVPLCPVPRLADALTTLRGGGFAILGADAHTGDPLHGFAFPPKSVIVLGSERHGLSPDVTRRCTGRIRIAGTSAVESLNVSVAAGILMAHAHAAATRVP